MPVLVLLLLLKLAMLLIGGSLLTFSVLALFRIDAWMADVACPIACQPILPACWKDTPDRSSSSSTRMVQDVRDVFRDVLGTSVDEFWSFWSRSAEEGLFRAYSLAGGPTVAGSSAFLGRGLLRIRNRRLGGRAAGGTVSSRLYRVSRVMMLMFIVLSTLFIPLFLLYFFSVDVSSLWLMFFTVLGVRGSLRLVADPLLRHWGAVCRHGPCGPITSLHPWDVWIPPDLHGFFKWVFDSLEALNGVS